MRSSTAVSTGLGLPSRSLVTGNSLSCTADGGSSGYLGTRRRSSARFVARMVGISRIRAGGFGGCWPSARSGSVADVALAAGGVPASRFPITATSAGSAGSGCASRGSGAASTRRRKLTPRDTLRTAVR